MSSSESELSDSDVELQEAFAEGRLKPGLNKVEAAPKQFVNNVGGLRQKLAEFKSSLPWIENLDLVNKQAPLAPELAAQLLIHEEKRENQLKNNKKLPQVDPSADPVLNDFKRETMFHRQAQAAVMEALPRLKAMGLKTIRPDDYFAEMAKTDEHMQKIRAHLMQKQVAKQRSERVKQLRAQRKEGKMLQVQAKLERQKEKKAMLDQVKKVRKGQSKDLGFLDGKNKSKKAIEKRKIRDKKFGFGGKKRGSKLNTKDSAADISEYRRPKKPVPGKKGKGASKRPGKNRRIKNRAKGKR
ncbi:probable rRNA-processing protein EBP2 homolog [Tribolium castaneum]|uniref:Putative rRNA-processing protein EBP2 homolog-like Protein n=1 Tax=Tribolium castaneum TaxID=7070 RepID=D6WZT9_TRICA|nr:PREDICTED: probable rRNA-processing protein EBP2 homolog [Tribolium castaneum]EFA10478.1 putative rRNA-processing protein EBP2 homolog-like Protein [Tribolium castaneum]|eukprot:XP_974552.1 PREDICTED: probable rRNA-processing protein EBP2 homolog [Tribolium castaneum]